MVHYLRHVPAGAGPGMFCFWEGLACADCPGIPLVHALPLPGDHGNLQLGDATGTKADPQSCQEEAL